MHFMAFTPFVASRISELRGAECIRRGFMPWAMSNMHVPRRRTNWGLGPMTRKKPKRFYVHVVKSPTATSTNKFPSIRYKVVLGLRSI